MGARGAPLCGPELGSDHSCPTENAAALEELLKEYHSKQLVQTSHRPVPR